MFFSRNRIAFLSLPALLLISFALFSFSRSGDAWNSKFLKVNKDGSISYFPDEKGNTIPDFSQVGYHHGKQAIPDLKILKILTAPEGDAGAMIQQALDELARQEPDDKGHRGAILLKKGVYKIAGVIRISSAGIVLRGEGEDTKLIAAGSGKRTLIEVGGRGKITELQGSRTAISNNYVPTGAKSFDLFDTKNFKAGDRIILFRPGTDNWIHDLQMDQIPPGAEKIVQWTGTAYNLSYEREIAAIEGSRIFIDNPVVMEMDKQYGGGAVFKYEYPGRISETGIENMSFESEFASDTDEDHGWIAVSFNHVENGWVRNISSRFFGYSCVSLGQGAKNITISDSKCFDAKSKIEGGRRYSFNNDGQQNLFINLETTEGRHDYVTGAKVCGPNVFYNCKSSRTHADIGPHHRWASGTLYDNIITDGEINVQDRGNWGTGHGWAGVTQVIWNCTASGAVVQSPWVSGKNYIVGLQGTQLNGRLKGRPAGEWEGQNHTQLQPASLFLAQVRASRIK